MKAFDDELVSCRGFHRPKIIVYRFAGVTRRRGTPSTNDVLLPRSSGDNSHNFAGERVMSGTNVVCDAECQYVAGRITGGSSCGLAANLIDRVTRYCDGPVKETALSLERPRRTRNVRPMLAQRDQLTSAWGA